MPEPKVGNGSGAPTWQTIFSMKRILAFIVLLTTSLALHAQPRAVDFEYNDNIFTHSFGFTYHHSFFNDRVRLYGGYNYIFNSEKIYFGNIKEQKYNTPDEHFVFYQPYSDAGIDRESLGMKIGAELRLFKSGDDAEVYSFYDFQYFKTDVIMVYGGVDPSGQVQVQSPFPVYSGMLYTYGHHLGIGLRHRLWEPIVLKAIAGFGMLKLASDFNYPVGGVLNGKELVSTAPQFSKMFGIGLEYTLNHKASKARNSKAKSRRR